MPGRAALVLSRSEAKSITRRRLLEAAARLLAGEGYAGLTASAVARAAGLAQPTFYVHFRDKDDLLRTLGEEQTALLRARLKETRKRVMRGEGVAAVRETFRVPLETWMEHPELFRLYTQEIHQPGSPLAQAMRRFRDEITNDLVEDLARMGAPAATPAERERLRMIADAMVAQSEALTSGCLEGRYSSVEAVVDVLTQFALGALGSDPAAAPPTRPGGGLR